MRRWSWPSILLTLHCCAIAICLEIRQLPYCKDSEPTSPLPSLLFVSTLDGQLTALDAARGGQKQWTLNFNTEPLLSSNIHRRDLNNNGQWVRLIPSLNGGLYKFDGETLEAIPVSVDQLLQSSFRYSDDLIFSGGKETKIYGVATSTGKILYECKTSSCSNATSADIALEEDVLIVRRHQHTVRAGEPRTGIERWNFSVGQHDLTMLPPTNSDCHNKILSKTLEIEVQAIVPEGIITVFNKNNRKNKLWEYKFDSPIVTIWKDQVSENGVVQLKEVNLFTASQLDSELDSEFSISPGLYIGMHKRQLYIQENPAIKKTIDYSSSNLKVIKYPWRPYPAIEFSKDVGNDKSKDTSFEMSEVLSSTALSVLYNSEYINGNGFYLYSKEQIQLDGNQCNSTGPKHMLIESSEAPSIEYKEDDTPVQVIIVSLWYWWKEVLIISITTAIVLNIMLTQKLLNATAETHDAVLPPLIIERHIVNSKDETFKIQTDDGDINFNSRYLTDYEPVDCLGHGGYGVVFEARNKIDDCNYAIKRIALPNSRYSRERVMREVKALAKLDHHNIVRYFNAWLECPPAGWQEEHDRHWCNHNKFPNSDFVSESSVPETSTHVEIPPSEPSSLDSACEAFDLDKDDEDSFIIFDAPMNGNCEAEHNEELRLSVSENVNDRQSDKTDQSIIFEDSKRNDLTERKSELNLDLRRRKDSGKSNMKMFLYIQMQLCQRLSLREWLKTQNSQRDILRILNIFQQIVDAVEYVHLQGLIHRDLKPSNIFFAFDDKIKIGDFGLVTAMTEGINGVHTPCNANEVNILKNVHTARVGTHLYMSPEQMNGQNYNYKVDIYSLGIILFELLIPFSTEMERVVALTNLRKSIFPNNFSLQYPDEFNLLEMMLDDDPKKRPTTLGIKARPPFVKNEIPISLKISENSKWHFELPHVRRNSSITNSNGSDSWENIH
ncbi:PREDICTED: eukaryotic translation initiation factor 2-alpha kinase [Ceratosolen solmsi marchali]|uniref:non-specific serine/threonine protein kinase n=1 Tax=Ceratosolen solmsi marchali TaxID=326594 RepID=A0AAJ6YXT1_9HYME|nr:PREDICTED: eukaryotic translation initiation factor 2-alpha kinase [Ceratosolen solmsi marchali]